MKKPDHIELILAGSGTHAVTSKAFSSVMAGTRKEHDRFGRADRRHAPVLPITFVTLDFLMQVTDLVKASEPDAVFQRVVAELLEKIIKKAGQPTEAVKALIKPVDDEFRRGHPVCPRIPMSDATCHFFNELSHAMDEEGGIPPMMVAGLLVEKFITDFGSPQKMLDGLNVA